MVIVVIGIVVIVMVIGIVVIVMVIVVIVNGKMFPLLKCKITPYV
jgi:hypothetical protein